MKKLVGKLILVVIVFACGWLLWNKDKFDSAESVANLAKQQLGALGSNIDLGKISDQFSSPSDNTQLASYGQPISESLRVATFNIQTFGQKKVNDQVVMQRLAQICSNFDVIAIQEIRSIDQTVLPRFIQQLNANGASYNFAASPRLGRTKYKEQAAFIYDESKVQLDDSFSYTINDPDDVLHREPFVGWFRARGPRLDQAFTFTLANLHMDSKRPDLELAYLTELHRIIRKDGRGEDDVILIGDFNADDRGLELARERGGLTWVITNTATNTRNTTQYDNIVFDAKATDEFLYRGGVFDFMKHLNLRLEDALAISDHMPVWAEFSIYEGGRVRTAMRK